MPTVERLGLSATQWRFLSKPQEYVKQSGGRLLPESTARQFKTVRDILARLDGCCGEEPRQGILLADDVGLGKTTVAALVAWIFASTGEKRRVRILAPNDVMVRRWKEELLSHVDILNSCSSTFKVQPHNVKVGAVRALKLGQIQVVKHSYASDARSKNLSCDLLIVDEAHRAKGENTKFSQGLKALKKSSARVLILTATPFSIQLEELNRMLTLVGAERTALTAVREYSSALDKLYKGSTTQSPEIVAKRLAIKATKAINEISRYVIRHSIDDLRKEKADLGLGVDWSITVPPASNDELELMLRMDRMLRLSNGGGVELTGATNDPRFHVGWQHFASKIVSMQEKAVQLGEPEKALVERQLREIKRLHKKVGTHSKMEAVAKDKELVATINKGEKVVIFCHHHATAEELTVVLDTFLPAISMSNKLPESVWIEAWSQLLKPAGEERHAHELRNTFIEWLCSDINCAQIEGGLGTSPTSVASLKNLLLRKRVGYPRAETFVQAAQRLYYELIESKSSNAVLLRVADGLELLPGSNGTSRVLGVCDPTSPDEKKNLFIQSKQPDTVISIFGSPFGPNVLVVTDKLSEGIDLHRYCRHLIHYELDPSPIRTVQRNGRVRRVNSWAAITGKPILYAYPAFGGTRDQRLVEIMKKRVATFSLLLGGVQDFDIDSTSAEDEIWRSEVVNKAKNQLKAEGGKLRAKEPGEEKS
jgi:ERCC4-related helicase